MKSIMLVAALLMSTAFNQILAQDTTKAQTSQILTAYYSLKDALVGSSAKVASEAAGNFVTAINAADKETVKDETRTTLLKDAEAIAKTKDLNIQREKFANLSATMYALAKTVKLSTDPVYQQYCPMKKTIWLSNSKAIKNPYYGSAMLTCGSLKETL